MEKDGREGNTNGHGASGFSTSATSGINTSITSGMVTSTTSRVITLLAEECLDGKYVWDMSRL